MKTGVSTGPCAVSSRPRRAAVVDERASSSNFIGGAMDGPFRVGITRDFLGPNGEPIWPGLAGVLHERFPGIEVEILAEQRPTIAPEQIRDFDAVVSFAVRYDRASLSQAERLVLLARFGVGYDTVDLQACTEADVLLTLTRGMA